MSAITKVLRLLLFSECDRSCRGCCNKDWNLTALPECQDYTGFDTVILTGGEPLLQPELIKSVASDIRKSTSAPIYVYTAMVKDPERFRDVLSVVDGVTLTLHSRKDVEPFVELMKAIPADELQGKSLRLNAFSTVSLKDVDTSAWKVKSGIRWIKDCPLPTQEVFMRIVGAS